MSSRLNPEADLNLNLTDSFYPGLTKAKAAIKEESDDDEIKTEPDTDSDYELIMNSIEHDEGEGEGESEGPSRFEGRKLRGRGFDLDSMPSGEPLLRDMHIWPGYNSKTAPTPTMYANRHGGSRSTVTKRVNQALDELLGDGASAAYRSMQKLPFPAVPEMRLATFDCAGAVDMMQRYGVAMALDMAKNAKRETFKDEELTQKRYDVVVDGVSKQISMQEVLDRCAMLRGDKNKDEYENYDDAFDADGDKKKPQATLLDGSELVFDFS